jgi:predicted SAM-dependent methyltransferase
VVLKIRSVQFDEFEYLVANPDVAEAIKVGSIVDGVSHYEEFGRHENRLLFDPQKSRVAKALHSVDRLGLGLEIGPSINPIAPKSEGFNVHIVDHLSAEDLKKKYKNHGVNIDSIEHVDFIWKGENLSNLIGSKECYDYIIASHVIEHIPDVITFLQQCALLLKSNGVLSLVIPDKRYCFDFFLPCSTTGQLIDAYDEKRIKPTRGQVFDSYANSSCTQSGKISWDDDNCEELRVMHSDFEVARKLYQKSSNVNEYVDAHCWRFIPDVFKLIISDLNLLSFIDLNILIDFQTKGCEFYITLIKTKTKIDSDRTSALKKIKKELYIKSRYDFS